MITGAVVLALLAVSIDRPLGEERQLLARRLETLRRILPDGPTAQADVVHVRELADAARLAGVDALARPPVESGGAGAVVIDFKASGGFLAIDRLFRSLTLSPRLVDVESLTITASNADVAQVAAVLRLPFRPPRAPLPAVPDGVRGQLGGVPKAVADAYLRDQALAVAKAEAIAAWRRTRRNPRAFLCELAAVVRDRPVVLTQATLGDEFRVRGITVGEATIQALERRFERGFFRVSDFTAARQGACQHFEVRGKSPVVGPDAELPVPSEDPFIQDDAPCRADRDGPATREVKGPKARPNGGPLTLRLRGVDAADVYQILSQLSGQAFLVDPDVDGRVSGELSRVTLEEALAALAEAGIATAPPAAVRRVSLVANVPWTVRAKPVKKGGGRGRESTAALAPEVSAPPVPSNGARVSLSLKRADVRDILATLAEVDPELVAFGPQGPLGRLSLWVGDRSVREVWAAVTRAARLSERFEEGRRLLERNPGSQDVLVPVAATASEGPRLVLGPQDLAVGELDLVAVATATDGWRAYVYTPNGTLVSYRAGDRLAGASVKAIESTDLLLDTDEGPLRVMLPAR